MMDTLQTVRRATVGRSVLGWVALVCLVLNGAFWLTLMIDLLKPPSPISPQAIQAGLSIAAFALILPLFWSMLLPSSPAGRLLQRQTWRLPGQIAVLGAALFLTYLAGFYLHNWWQAQPVVNETGQDLFLTITSLIAGVLVPALSWCVMTPEQWIAQIEQARQVKRLEQSMKMEEAAMRAAYARAVSLLHADLSNLTIAQRRELAGILGGFARTQQQALTSIAQSWKDMYGVEAQLASVPDQELLASYQQVAGLLAEGADVMAGSATYAGQVYALGELSGRAVGRERTPIERSTTSRPDAETVDRSAVGECDRLPTSGQAAGRQPTDRSTTGRSPHVPHEQAYCVAYKELSGAWRRAELERVLDVSKTQALEYISDWIASGDLASLTEPRNHYEWR